MAPEAPAPQSAADGAIYLTNGKGLFRVVGPALDEEGATTVEDALTEATYDVPNQILCEWKVVKRG